MRTRQFLIIDDNRADADHLINMLNRLFFFRSVGVASTLDEATHMLKTEAIDLVFLDIRLMDQSGLAFLKVDMRLPPVIITSAYPEYAVESYRIGKASDYLLKPFTDERLQIALSRTIKINAPHTVVSESPSVFLKTGRKVQRFNYESIDYIEAFGIYTKLYVDNQYTLTNERLSSIKKLLPEHAFIQVHKSYIININKITTYDRNTFWIGKSKIPIGPSYRPYLENLLPLFGRDD
ncbi:LytTR family two component transcriptional regulator [Spirosoma oryzae]|uniref:LytTR family two component transcriptional regulator n=1 Tax=Spirosoma oryzae TaxID=1469603 RepID=A0A2T0S8M5_9BACT|nr:LytTR family DNA-binding domain-containing protein [Spirosoma oryzae]PRY29752.1 LytTR family two component transcriptional regulator [Spirosoma oryzae]